MATLRWISLGIVSLTLCGQTPPTSAVEPETLGKVFFLDASQTLKELPAEPWKRQTKRSRREGLQSINVVTGTRSSFRISSSDKIVFVYRPFLATGQTVDPVQTIQLFGFVAGEKDRTCVISTVKTSIRKGNSVESNQGLPLDIGKFGTSSYTLSPQGSHLPPGEYWINTPGVNNRPLTTFGVD
jgi:hypothetical protein